MKQAAQHVTKVNEFSQCSSDGPKLFSVRAGVCAADALQTASAQLDTVRSLISRAVADLEPNEHVSGQTSNLLYAAMSLLDSSKAVVDAVEPGLNS